MLAARRPPRRPPWGLLCVCVCVRARASVSVTVGINKHNLMHTHVHSTITQACTNTHTPIHGRCGSP